jgi:hypothetical protein
MLEALSKGHLRGRKVSEAVVREARRRLPLARESVKYDRPGPTHLGRAHFERVAEIYTDALMRRRPPTNTVADAFGVPYPTAARWVSRARHEYRLLPKTKRGRARSVGGSKRSSPS